MSETYQRGEEVVIEGVGKAVVIQCVSGVGGFRVIAKGPWSRANIHGLFDFPIEKVAKSEGRHD